MSGDGLKQKTLKGLLWSFTDNFVTQGSSFIVGIILARLLSPKEFGLIGMIMIFIQVSRVFIDSGFSQALIRKKDCGQKDYSTIFYFNLLVGLFFYGLLFFFAEAIGAFYNERQLVPLIRVLGLVLIINASAFIQRTILTKNIDFKLQMKISLVSSIASGALAVWLAWRGWGVWSLVFKTICQDMISTALLWAWNRWKPEWLFSVASFKEMFGFGSKLLLSALIDTIYSSVYYVVIGKCYSAVELGYYTRADNFQSLPSANLTVIVQRVSYPVLASIQDDNVRLKGAYKKLIRSAMFISLFVLIGMAAAAESFVVLTVGEKWLPAVPYLRWLCLIGTLYPLHALNLSMLNIKGRSDLFLRLEVIKKLMNIIPVVTGIFFGIQAMLALMLLNTIAAYFLNSAWSGKMVGYPVKEQLLDIAPLLAGSIAMGGAIFFLGKVLPFGRTAVFFAQCVFGLSAAALVAYLSRLEIAGEVRKIIVGRLSPAA